VSLKLTFKSIFYLQRVTSQIEKGKRAGLFRICGYIRGACIRSLRIAKTASTPGNPPHAHTRGGLRLIEYSVYENGGIIGPIKFTSSNFFNEPIPHIHEFGGTYMHRKGYSQYPQRSYMGSTLARLHQRGVIPKEFSASLARYI